MSTHPLMTAQNMVDDWKQEGKERQDYDVILDSIRSDWERPKALYNKYKAQALRPVTQQTFSQYLLELEALGELESKGYGHSRRYRRADTPVREVVGAEGSRELQGLTEKIRAIAIQEVRKSIEKGELNEVIRKQQNTDLLKALFQSSDFETFRTAMHRQKQKNEIGLPTDKQVLLEIIRSSATSVSMPEIYEEYEQRVEEPASERTVRRKLSELHKKGFIQKNGRTRNTRYKAV